ncbi:bifunctional lysine ketoglutarate reductase /saccharopine dehydrogenase family protein [Kangiella koreensis]|uniref:Saccharopine dehydrogenase [NAD(+), L-lysine-forming] n=1 Tax=Kangiella koreensis (strain DSM 16069 / JCM 12317 / KCTC 12182 / SW-125) TaxID=523791 RepID=C7RBC4_KANKD|nr:bifunctional lysine ketoglutarate reductase /saccharopine dehydrogenase family protein [Kangiella koreensis]ACV26566.1 alanine dehydrogenase/PNT domain protein [Kangiella koreensis DSM 16069]
MLKTIIRKEHKNKWEKRAPLTPKAVKTLTEQGLSIELEPCDIRIFPDQDYQAAGAIYPSSPDQAEFVLGIKEPPVGSIKHGQVHLAFSHTIKGQEYNMPLLQKFLDEDATLLDYEPIVDPATGQRTIAFGRYAGIAGAVDSFAVLGEKLAQKELATPLSELKMTHTYGTVENLKQSLEQFDLSQGEPIRALVVGTGKVGKGSIEVCEWLGLPKVSAKDFLAGNLPEGSFYAVLSSRHINRRKDGGEFSMKEFVAKGSELYESTFDQVLGKFNILLQTPYWEEMYPKHLTKERMQQFKDKLPLVIGDISCDINGSLECTTKASDSDNPAFTYNVDTGDSQDGISWQGVTVMSIDNLPCELPIDASNDFSKALTTYAPQIMQMDLSKPFAECGLPKDLADAVIVYKGQLTPNYEYLKEYLS